MRKTGGLYLLHVEHVSLSLPASREVAGPVGNLARSRRLAGSCRSHGILMEVHRLYFTAAPTFAM